MLGKLVLQSNDMLTYVNMSSKEIVFAIKEFVNLPKKKILKISRSLLIIFYDRLLYVY